MNEEPTHGGGLVYRAGPEGVQYLIVRPRKIFDEWILPKGHIEKGETPEETAVREVEEETGVAARAIAPLDALQFESKGNLIRVQFFLMEFLKQSGAGEDRETQWVDYQTALTLLTHETSRQMLRAAERKRSGA